MICYTTIFGDYDTLADPPFTSIPLVCFTNQRKLQSTSWKIINVDLCDDSINGRIRMARQYKLLPHKFLPDEEGWIWIDANLKLKTDPAIISQFLNEHDLATFRYPSTWGPRECLYDEAKACILRKKDDPNLISAQIERYREEGYPEKNGLVETSIVVRRNTRSCCRFNEIWWREISSGSRRDQISFPYVAWLLGFDYGIIPGCRINNAFSNWEPHRENVYI